MSSVRYGKFWACDRCRRVDRNAKPPAQAAWRRPRGQKRSEITAAALHGTQGDVRTVRALRQKPLYGEVCPQGTGP